MQVKIKKVRNNAVIPTYAKPGDAGLDLTVCHVERQDSLMQTKVYFGLSIEIPNGYVGLIFPRSSIFQKGVFLSNSVGVIDSGYRGEISAVFYQSEKNIVIPDVGVIAPLGYNVGERAAQLIIMPYPQIEFVEVEELSDTERGVGGYGSSGK